MDDVAVVRLEMSCAGEGMNRPEIHNSHSSHGFLHAFGGGAEEDYEETFELTGDGLGASVSKNCHCICEKHPAIAYRLFENIQK
ncbi:MAG: hypothetical protein LBD67_05130 [Candidatus Accumulibacter sp.]|jgi:hypothetical protein|nr:hypothetical protein [Accumulibacter sp.]